MRTQAVPWKAASLLMLALIACIIVGVFVWGWAMFTGRRRIPPPRRPSPRYERFAPKVFGGFAMWWACCALVITTLGLLGVFN